MNVTDLLDRPIAYHRIFVRLTGSVKAAILLSQAMYWQKRAKQADGWWYKTAEEWEDETGLTRHELDTARDACERYLKTKLKDAPARLYWKVDEGALSEDLIDAKSKPSLPKSGKLERRKAANINKNAETTTENTSETTTEGATPPRVKANDFPSNVLYREVTEKYPAKANWHTVLKFIDGVSRRLGRQPTKEDLFPFYEAWCANGWNPNAINWLDYALKGELPKNGKSTPQPKQNIIQSWLSKKEAQHVESY